MQEETETTNGRDTLIEESGLEIGTGDGYRDTPYIIDIDQMQTGNITDYVTGTPRLYYRTPAESGKTYTGTLVVTGTSVERTPFWVELVGNDGTWQETDAMRLEGLDLVGQDITVSIEVSEFGSEVNFILSTNALGEDVFFEFYIEEN